MNVVDNLYSLIVVNCSLILIHAMEFESDVVPLIEDVSDGNRDLFLELNAQVIDDPDFEQVNIIYY